ncbi:MAG: efflux RND transporter periplasmic adaptor subunit [Caulobacteraceae bacterium]|nr:efflux RND transporter periplasmic adaptor subunit [Caulobacter sp.]
MRPSRLAAPLAAAWALAACHKAPPPPPPPPQVGYVVVQTHPVVLDTELPGRTNPFVTADVRPQVNGIVTQRLFTEGTDVRQGQALYQIDPKPYQAAVEQARAQLANAQANLVTTRLQAQRYAELVKINAVSRQDNDNAQASYGQARANVQQYQAALDAARINLGYTTIRAPVSGRIGRSLITIGALATNGQTNALATIQALDPIYVDVTQSSDELLKLTQAVSQGGLNKSPTAHAKLILSDGSTYAQEGLIRFSDAQVDPTTGSVILRALFPNPNRTLLPGMYVRERIEQAIDPNGILVPQTAVTRDPKGDATVMVVDGDAAQTRPVSIGRAINNDWLLTSGLKPGDKLITEGGAKVQKPGTKVRAVPADQVKNAPANPPKGAGSKKPSDATGGANGSNGGGASSSSSAG